MARVAKDAKNIQVFRGGNPRPSVFEKHAGIGCCASGVTTVTDKLPDVLHFDNGLNHLNPTGGNEKYNFPNGSPSGSFETDRLAIIQHINDNGVGAQVSVIAIPNYAFLTGVAIKVYAEEEGLTFTLKTRNGLTLPDDVVKVIETAAVEGSCSMTRTVTDGDATSFTGFGALGTDNIFKDIVARSANGEFAAEADEIIVEVATMPTSGSISGNFGFEIAVNYDVVGRAERL